ncbi:MAG: PHP domain-containing protein [Acutalibacteraceae bacterium]|nr:PHP domain-containing protein [Acutalibacteraceae bacterium]
MYLYELHCHTLETSRCASSSGKDYIKLYKDMGYSGIFITDHFFNGNTCVDPNLPWEERVGEFMTGYKIAKEEGEKQGIDVFFGFEYSYRWCHLLTYGLDEQWLLDNPDILSLSPADYLKKVREDGGMVIHAHPFRDGVELVRLFPDLVDGIEVYNASQPDEANRRALAYAEMLSLPTVAGSDIHSVNKTVLGAVGFESKITHINDFINKVKTNQAHIIKNRRD